MRFSGLVLHRTVTRHAYSAQQGFAAGLCTLATLARTPSYFEFARACDVVGVRVSVCCHHQVHTQVINDLQVTLSLQASAALISRLNITWC